MKGAFDLALACKLVGENSTIVCNDFYLEGKERVLVVSVVNQGGKTTFARAFGQLHYLASIPWGVRWLGREADLFFFSTGSLRISKRKKILQLFAVSWRMTLCESVPFLTRRRQSSVIIMNEIFNSTTLRDAIFLGKGYHGKDHAA